MYHTFLDLSFRKAGGDRFAESAEVIYAADQDVLNAAISQLIEDNQPEPSRFMFDVSVPGYRNLRFTVFAGNRLLAVPVSSVVAVLGVLPFFLKPKVVSSSASII